jgi:hypothetical protein
MIARAVLHVDVNSAAIASNVAASSTAAMHTCQWRTHELCVLFPCYAGGYSKPGFPGVIICEGATDDVGEYVARIRALQWQAMQIRHEEEVRCLDCKTSAAAANGNLTGASSAGDAVSRGCLRGASMPCRGFTQRFSELPETGLSELGQHCKDAGLEHIFQSALKLSGK